MSAVFVTASGTALGKTAICEALLAQLRRDGWVCTAYKPIATGFETTAESDTGRLLLAQRKALTPWNFDAISPWRFAAPLSPDVAARREGRRIDFDALVHFCRGASIDGIALIEGVGGVMVPLTEQHTVLDWIVALDGPTLLVVGSYLGALSHALTAATVLLASGVTLAGIVVNQSETEPMATSETAAALRCFVPGVPIGIVARARSGATLEVGYVREMLRPYLPEQKRSPPAGE